MSKQLYEEALADARQIKQVAEDNAKQAILDIVTPRIRNLIERQILSEDDDLDEKDQDDEQNVLVDDSVPTEQTQPIKPADSLAPSVHTAPVQTLGSAQGKVTIDAGNIVQAPSMGCDAGAAAPQPPAVPQPPPPTLPSSAVGSGMAPQSEVSPIVAADETPSPEVDEFELNLESLDALKIVAAGAKPGLVKSLHSVARRLGESLDRFKGAGKVIRNTTGYQSQILEMISRVENMYECVQESVKDPAEKKKLERQLESYYGDLKKLGESKMKKQLSETDVTLKLTGLPDDVDLDQVGVDLISDDGEEVTPGEEGGELPSDEDLDLDAAGGGEGEEEDLDAEAVSHSMDEMDDDTMVEIDETMLRREIAKMKKVNEAAGKDEHKPWSAAAGVDSKVAHDFGDGKEEEEAFEDGEVTTGGFEPLGEGEEADDDDEELDELAVPSMSSSSMEEADGYGEDLDELGLKRKEDDHGAQAANAHSVKAEARLSFEKRLQKRLTERLAQLKKLHGNAMSKNDKNKVREAKSAWDRNVKRLTESRARVQKLNKLMAEATKRNQASPNGGQRRSAGAGTDVKNLRERLDQVNLDNAKLLHTNKLLQNESLTARQKQQIVERLDEAKTVREVKLVYESLVKTLVGDKKPLSEGSERRVMGSGSRPTRSAGSVNLTESHEAARWARLAGITK